MEFSELLAIVGDIPVFESALLLAGKVDTADVRRQLTRWTNAGQLYQMRRGLYALAPPYQKTKPHPFALANALVHGSYISLQSALANYDLIPEYTPVVTSVTTGRPGRYETPLGVFVFRHIKTSWFHGYRRQELGNDEWAFIASPEKALLDLVYLEPGGDDPGYLNELRLQNMGRLDLDALTRLADESAGHKLVRAARQIAAMASEAVEYTTL